MKKKLLVLFFPFFLLLGCGGDGPPVSVMNMDEMAAILTEMQIAHAGVDVTVTQEEGKLTALQEYNAAVLDRRGVDRESFFESYQWYQDHPALMDSVYSRVLKTLETKIDSILLVDEVGDYQPINKSKD